MVKNAAVIAVAQASLFPSYLSYAYLQYTFIFQVYIHGSNGRNDQGMPFGYLKASTNLQVVNLFVLPYDYPRLMPLLSKLLLLLLLSSLLLLK